jgi:hypothetical protein
MRIPRLLRASAALALLSASASAGNGSPEPGSVLVFPLIEGGNGATTLVTVTNSNPDMTEVGNLPAGTVDVHYVYINGDPLNGIFYCGESNRARRLTPNDTLTVSSALDNTSFARGWLYVFAKSPTTGQAIAWNWLIGHATVITAVPESYSYAPYVFRTGNRLAQGMATDMDGDGQRDLNGSEYERVVDTLLVPQFFGETADRHAYLVLVNLSGSGQFYASVNFLIYNDSEDVFSSGYLFRCWAKVRLQQISGSFTQSFLTSTSSSPSESVLGARSGWYRLDGGVASSSADQVDDPALLALQVASWFFAGAGGGRDTWADLPFSQGLNPSQGELVNQGVFHP